jgi:hypothetical protein
MLDYLARAVSYDRKSAIKFASVLKHKLAVA